LTGCADLKKAIAFLSFNAVSGAVVLAHNPQPSTTTGTFTGPGVFFDLTAVYSSTGQPAAIQSGYSYTITIHYDEANLSPTVSEASLAIYWHNPATDEWAEIPSTVDAAHNIITGVIDHLSQFAVLGIEHKIYLPAVLKNH